MKCTYLYNHAIYFNQTLHKLGKQAELSKCTGKIDDLWPTSRSCDPIWLPNPLSKCQNWHVLDHISKNPWDILLIYLLLFCYSPVLNYRSKKKKKKNTSIPLFDFRIQWNIFWLDSSVRSKVEVITGCGHIGLGNPGNCSSFYNANKTHLVRAANLFTAHKARDACRMEDGTR